MTANNVCIITTETARLLTHLYAGEAVVPYRLLIDNNECSCVIFFDFDSSRAVLVSVRGIEIVTSDYTSLTYAWDQIDQGVRLGTDFVGRVKARDFETRTALPLLERDPSKQEELMFPCSLVFSLINAIHASQRRTL